VPADTTTSLALGDDALALGGELAESSVWPRKQWRPWWGGGQEKQRKGEELVDRDRRTVAILDV
jgi:hypothetical protein